MCDKCSQQWVRNRIYKYITPLKPIYDSFHHIYKDTNCFHFGMGYFYILYKPSSSLLLGSKVISVSVLSTEGCYM